MGSKVTRTTRVPSPRFQFDYSLPNMPPFAETAAAAASPEAKLFDEPLVDRNKFGAISNFLYVLAGVALFTTGTAPVITPETDFLNDPFAMAWAGWKFTGCLFFAMVNWGVSLPTSNAIAMTIYVLFDIFAVMDTEHWTSAAYGFILIDGLIGILSLRQILLRRLRGARSGATRQPNGLLPDGTPKSDEMLDAAANAA